MSSKQSDRTNTYHCSCCGVTHTQSDWERLELIGTTPELGEWRQCHCNSTLVEHELDEDQEVA